jgi:hypothetical protein
MRGRSNQRGRFEQIRKVYAHDPEVWVRVGLGWFPNSTIPPRLSDGPATGVPFENLLYANAPHVIEKASSAVLAAMGQSPASRTDTDKLVDKMIPWLARETARGLKQARRNKDAGVRAASEIDLITMLNYAIVRNIKDWRRAPAHEGGGAQVNLGKATWRDVTGASQAWHLKMLETEGRWLGSDDQGIVVYRWPDGWTMQELDTAELLEAEGEAMQSCVGGNDYEHRALEELTALIYSLRNPRGQPRVTVEVEATRDDDGRGGERAEPANIEQAEGRSQSNPPR